MKMQLRLWSCCLLALLWVQWGQAQNNRLSGRVLSAEGNEALIGAKVIIKGSTVGTLTDENGYFQLTVPQDLQQGTLQVSYYGYETQEIPINGRSTINVSLKTEIGSLDEVVIVAYGTARRQDLTGAVSSIDGDEIKTVPVAGIDQALQGRIAGVSVTATNGQPGGGVAVRVRGPSSINSSNQPLYVIDGIPVEPQNLQIDGQFGTPGSGGLGGQLGNTMSTINFSDVESIEVLKDASATALYGSRAANGVILITTRNGQYNQKAQFDLNYSAGQMTTFELPDMLNAAQYRELLDEARANAGLSPLPDSFYGNADTDWMKEIFRDALIQQWNLSLKGGSENTRYFASFNIDNQEGTLKGTDFFRLSGRLNLDTKVSERIRFGTRVGISHTTENVQANDNFIIGPYFTALRARPDQPVFNEDGSFTSINTPDNPVAATTYQNEFQTLRILASGFGEYEIIDNLRLKSSLAIDFTNLKQDQYWNTNTLGGILFGSGYAQRGNNEFRSVIFENTLSYDVNLNDQNRLSALLGASWQRDQRLSVVASATGFPNDQLVTFRSAATPLFVDGTGTERGLVSYFGRINYNYDERWLLTATLRTDGSSRFGENNRYGFFPSAAVAWRLSNEAFLDGATWLSDLKLRTSWGIIGNDRVGNFASRGLFSGDVSYAGSGGVRPSQIANPELKWETTTQYDAGLDFGFFEQRLSGSVDFYLKNTTDILLLAPVPLNSGFTSVNQNIGEMRNIGVDITLAADIVRSGDFRWTLSGNVNFNDNEIISLVNGEDISATGFDQSIIREGEDLGAFFGWKVKGIIQSQEEIEALNETAPGGVYQTALTGPGDFLYEDINGDNVINNDDRTVIGSAQYKFMGGITNQLSYKGITLNAFVQFVQGNDVFNMTAQEGLVFANLNNAFTGALDRWTPTNTQTDIPRAIIGDPNQNKRNSDFYVEDGSYIRLKTLNISYDLPASLLDKVFVRSLRVYVQGTNLFTITDYSGVDPEINTFGGQASTALGVDNNTYPGGKALSVGVNIGL
ncbi:MAG: TonB-dependent receptor [Bacteroidetes bacterium]|nr:MAG: TonB-dependent receptor [Bacteroidota bacterium]